MSVVEIQNLKLRIFNSNIKAVLLFGAETWMVTKPITDRVQVFVNRFLRSILGIRWPLVICNEDLWEITNKERVANEIRRSKQYGHTLSKPKDWVTRQVLFWIPYSRRERDAQNWPGGRFSKVPETFRARKAIKNLKSYDRRAVSFTYILNVNRGFLHTRSFRRIHFSVFRCRVTKLRWLYGLETFPGRWKNGQLETISGPRTW